MKQTHRLITGLTTMLIALSVEAQSCAVEQVSIRQPGGVKEFGFQLAGDFPIIKRFSVTH